MAEKKIDQKPDLIILEGADKAGKSTIYQAFRRATNYQPLVIDRFIGSNIVYDRLHDRNVPGLINHYYQTEDKMRTIFNPLVVYLYAPISLLLARSESTGESEEERFDIENIAEYYNEYLNSTILDVVSFDTSVYSIKEIVKIIIKVLEERKE